MKSILLTAIAIFGAVGISTAAYAQVRFTGNTTAESQLIHDALLHVMIIAKAKFSCTKLEAVESKMLPPDFRPPASLQVPTGPRTTYEVWTTTLCGTPADFLLTFWDAPDGGTMFAVGFPFEKPADAS